MKKLFSIFSFIKEHPISRKNKFSSFKKFIKWQLSQRMMPYPVFYPFIENTGLLVSKGMAGATGNIYVGLHEFEDMSFLLHFLRKEDSFADVGANIGSYTVLASGVVGAKSTTLEPVPSTFRNLERNIFLNNISDKVRALNKGAGSKSGHLSFTSEHDTVNHVVLNPVNTQNLVIVEIVTLDELFVEHSKPSLLKIDVEGFETEVLDGASELLRNTDLKAIIIELIGGGASFGFDEKDIHNKLVSLGFASYMYAPFERKLTEIKEFGPHNNTLYIRDIDFVTNRVTTARKFKVLSQEV